MRKPSAFPGLRVTSRRTKAHGRIPLHLLLALTVGLMPFVIPTRLSAAERDDRPSFRVLVFNFRQVPSDILAEAEREATRIFGRAGVAVTWRHCSTETEPCLKGSGQVLLLSIRSGPEQNTLLDTVSGYAIPPSHLAIVYYDYLPRVPDSASASSDNATILGCVITHELGHLLLGEQGHSIAGIMRADWDREQTRRALRSQVSFLSQQSEFIRRVLSEKGQSGIPAGTALVSHRK